MRSHTSGPAVPMVALLRLERAADIALREAVEKVGSDTLRTELRALQLAHGQRLDRLERVLGAARSPASSAWLAAPTPASDDRALLMHALRRLHRLRDAYTDAARSAADGYAPLLQALADDAERQHDAVQAHLHELIVESAPRHPGAVVTRDAPRAG